MKIKQDLSKISKSFNEFFSSAKNILQKLTKSPFLMEQFFFGIWLLMAFCNFIVVIG